MKFHTLTCILLFVLIAGSAYPRDLMRYERFTDNDGLADNRVTSICEDADGVIWLSTWNGLCCWNGRKLKSYVADEDGKKFGRIHKLQALSDGTLFFQNDANDSLCYDPRQHKLCPLTDTVSLSPRIRSTLADVVEGEFGLTIVRNGNVYQLPYSEGVRQEKQLHAFYEDSKGDLWLDFRHSLYHIWFEPSPFFYHYTWPWGKSSPFQSTVRALFATSSGDLLAASRVNRIYGLSDTIVSVPYPGNVYKIVEDDQRRLWMALRRKGLYIWNEAEGLIPAIADSLEHQITDAFTVLRLRHQSVLWTGTWGHGIYVLDISGDKAAVTSTICNDSLKSIHQFIQLQNGLIGVCTTSGFHLYSQTGVPVYVSMPQWDVLCAVEMPKQQILLSTMGHGLFWMSPNGTIMEDSKLGISDRISSLYMDTDSALWLVSDTRLYRYSPKSGHVDRLDEQDFGEEVSFSEETIIQYRDSLLCIGATSGIVEINLRQIDSYLSERQKAIERSFTEKVLLYTFIALGIIILVVLIVWIVWRGLVMHIKGNQPEQVFVETVQPQIMTTMSVDKNEDELFRAKVESVIDSALSNSMLDITMLSKMMDMPKNAFYYRCNEVFQTSPAALLQDRRMERAKMLLDKGSLSVREVAFQVGFNDPKYFSKVFKIKYGITPSQVHKDDE